MKKLILIAVLLITSFVSNATLLTVELDNPSGAYNVGDKLTANIVISDIEEGLFGQKLLSAFEFNLNFDNSMLAFDSVVFGTSVSNDMFFQNATPNSSDVKLLETSLFPIHDIFGQVLTPSFGLASITFDVIGAGASGLSLNNVMMFDENSMFFKQVKTVDARFSASAASVPVPATMPLLAIAGLVFFGMRKRSA